MKLTLAVQLFEGSFYVVSAYDDNTLDAWAGQVPDFHKEAIDAAEGDVRECVLWIDDEGIDDVFRPREVDATWEPA